MLLLLLNLGASTYSASVTENVTATDTSSAVVIASAASTENAAATDTTTAIFTGVASVTENASASSTHTAIFTTSAAITENGSATDTTAGGTNISGAITENATASESSSTIKTTSGTITEAGSASESSTAISGSISTITESASATDTSGGTYVTAAARVEGATATDTVQGSATDSVSVVEQATAVDIRSATTNVIASVSESASASESSSAVSTRVASITESASATSTASSIVPTIRVVNFPVDGHLQIDPILFPAIQPGDTVYLRSTGVCKSVEVFDMVGSLGQRINFTNYPGEQLIFNNVGWTLAQGWGTAIKFTRCKHFNFFGTDFAGCPTGEAIKTAGSTTADAKSNFHFQALELSDNFDIYDFSTFNGGTGIQIKTFVTSDPTTWRENTTLHNVGMTRLKLNNTGNEAVYFGDTAPYVNKDTGVVWGPADVNDPIPTGGTSVYKKPVLYNNVSCSYVNVQTSGNDGLQFAVCDGLEIHHNFVTEWALNDSDGHKGGILVGGSCFNTNVHDNICMNSTYGWGFWHFGEGPNHICHNNLFWNHEGYMVFLKGGTHLQPDGDYHILITNNTFADNGPGTYATGIRINGIQGGTLPQTFKNNIVAQVGGRKYDNSIEWIAVEQGGQIEEGTGSDANVYFDYITGHGLNEENLLQPFVEPGGTVDGKGYRSTSTGSSFFDTVTESVSATESSSTTKVAGASIVEQANATSAHSAGGLQIAGITESASATDYSIVIAEDFVVSRETEITEVYSRITPIYEVLSRETLIKE